MIAQIESAAGAAGIRGTQTYEIEVVLTAVEPRIWRRLRVPGNANLGWLHAVLQVTMGWTNSHLHQFLCGAQVYADPRAELEAFEGGPSVLDEGKAKLAKVAPASGDGLMYEYDFGDSWGHRVTVVKIMSSPAASAPHAVCLAGGRACPPEDCGGPGGYEELLKTLKNRKHPEHKSMKEWLGRPFDAEAFDPAEVNLWLPRLGWPHLTEGRLRKVLMTREGYRECRG